MNIFLTVETKETKEPLTAGDVVNLRSVLKVIKAGVQSYLTEV